MNKSTLIDRLSNHKKFVLYALATFVHLASFAAFVDAVDQKASLLSMLGPVLVWIVSFPLACAFYGMTLDFLRSKTKTQ